MALYLFIFFVFSTSMFASATIEAVRTDTPPKIDGVLDDLIWKQTKGYTEFISFLPEYGKIPKEKTVAYMAYDADYLYFGFKCYDREPEKIVATLYKRDAANRDDKVVVYIDSRNNGQNAYYFAINPFGIQTDGIMDSQAYSDGSQDFIWESEGTKDAEGYTIELKIPFQSLRFSKSKLVNMRVGFLRKINRYAEQYTYPDWKLGTGSIVDQMALVELENIHSKRVFEVLPSFTYMDRQERNAAGQMQGVDDKKVNLGLSSKIGLTSDLTLDMAVNPDFSHIEGDEGQLDVNLRVKTLKVEKRPFFLEGLEHFLFAGTGDTSPLELVFHSRNIKAPVFGLKLSGKAGQSGILNSLFVIDDEEGPALIDPRSLTVDPGKNYYGVLRYKQLLAGDSYAGGLYTSKEYKGGFYRLGGIDSKIRLNGSMTLDGYFLYSFKRESPTKEQNKGQAHGVKWRFDTNKYTASLGYDDVAKSFWLDTGRLTRNGVRSFSAYVDGRIFTKSEFLKRILFGYSGTLNTDKYYDMNDYSHSFFSTLDFPSYSSLTIGYDFATEVYDEALFKKNRFSISGKIQANKYLYLQLEYSTGGWPNYVDSKQGNGDEQYFYINLQFQPSEQFSSVFSYRHRVYHVRSSNEKLYDISIYRNKTIYQLNKYLSFRGIVEYYNDTKKIICDALAEFTYIPGTVIHLGYGPTFKRYSVDDITYPFDRFRLVSSAFFFKASYLFRF